jgi:hypothetical protein
VLSAIAIIPSAPVLVPELAGDAAAELVELREAVFACARPLPDRWIAVGVGAADRWIEPDAAGTFAGYGADVTVALSPGAHAVGPLPLCALITAWVRGTVRPDARAQVRCHAAALDTAAAVAQGRLLRAEIDAAADPVGVLVVADGANTLTPSAPGGYLPETERVQLSLDDALASGAVAGLTGLPDEVVGRVAFGVLAGLADAPRQACERYRGAPYGVGYFVGLWTP